MFIQYTGMKHHIVFLSAKSAVIHFFFLILFSVGQSVFNH